MLLPCTELHIYSYCLLIIYTVRIDLLVNARSLVTWILPSSGCFNAAAIWGVPFHLEPWDFSRTRCIWNAKIIQYLGKQKTCHFTHIQFVVWQQVWLLGGNSDKFYVTHFPSKNKKKKKCMVHLWLTCGITEYITGRREFPLWLKINENNFTNLVIRRVFPG